MVVSTAGNDRVATVHQTLGNGPCVGQCLRLIVIELWRHGFFERHSLGRNHVHQGSALAAGEKGRIQLLFNIGI